MTISSITHSEYDKLYDDYEKFRYVYEGGRDFRARYLEKLSTRESDADFKTRRKISYIPTFAKAALIEIKNSIFNRLVDVKRLGGSEQFLRKCKGLDGGVDRGNSSMNSFMGATVLPELLALGKVGVYVDSTQLANPTGTKMDDDLRKVYLYIYKAEDILSWAHDENGVLQSLLLQATVPVVDDKYGLVTEEETVFRHIRRVDGKVEFREYSSDETVIKERTLNIPYIPFTVGKLPSSLLTDVADYQIAHLNMASADVNYAIKGNFPFYVEEQTQFGTRPQIRRANSIDVDDVTPVDGTATRAGVAETPEIKVGAVGGRSYPKGAQAPSFIHPSPEPLEVSMKKQDDMKREIRQLVQLAVSNMDPKRESAESKQQDNRGLESGLSYIGQELEKMEREIATIWASYQGIDVAQIEYPENYSLKSDAERLEDATKITETSKTSASITFQKETAKLAATTLLGNKVDYDTMQKIHQEIDKATVAYVDPAQLVLDVEAALVTTQAAAELRGYGADEADKAEEQRVRKAAMIVAAQAKAGAIPAGSARGVPELDVDKSSAKDEKTLSQDGSTDLDGKKGVRGDG